MPLNLHGEDVRGTEVVGSKSAIYCNYCYGTGAFLEPNIEFEQMLEKGKSANSNGKGNAVVKFLVKASYPMMLKIAERWKNRIFSSN